jgi:hypothetical protein
MPMSRRPPERIEVVCEACGVIAEISAPRRRGAPLPKLCDCAAPRSVAASTRPRLCARCSTRLNRYNPGPECGPCRHARERLLDRI